MKKTQGQKTRKTKLRFPIVPCTHALEADAANSLTITYCEVPMHKVVRVFRGKELLSGLPCLH